MMHTTKRLYFVSLLQVIDHCWTLLKNLLTTFYPSALTTIINYLESTWLCSTKIYYIYQCGIQACGIQLVYRGSDLERWVAI